MINKHHNIERQKDSHVLKENHNRARREKIKTYFLTEISGEGEGRSGEEKA